MIIGNLGLSLFGSITSAWTNGVDLKKYLDSDGLIQHFRENHAADPTYLQKKIQTHLLDNKVSPVHDEMVEAVESHREAIIAWCPYCIPS